MELSTEKAKATAALSNSLKGTQKSPNSKLFKGSNIEHSLHNQFNGRRNFFPQKLHILLKEVELSGKESIVSWLPHGGAFRVHDRKEFAKTILPQYFDHSNILSFHRQLNLYSFRRIKFGVDSGAYYHDMFLRDEPLRCLGIETQRIKRNEGRKLYNTGTDPNSFDSEAFSESVASSQANDIRSEEEWNAHKCDQNEGFTATDHQRKLNNVVSFEENITQSEHNCLRIAFPGFAETRACMRFESESKSEDLTDSSVVNANLSREAVQAFFASLSELLKEEIEQESCEANNTASPTYVEADAIYTDGGLLNSQCLSASENHIEIGLKNFLRNVFHTNENELLPDDDIMTLCSEDWLI